MKGKNFLKVTGILMIIGGALGIVIGLIAIVGVGAMAALLNISSGGLMFSSVLVLLSAVFQLIAGIMGVSNCEKPEKAQSCLIMGIIVAVLCIAGNIISNVMGTEFNIFSYIIGLVIPVLYIIGAAKNKASA